MKQKSLKNLENFFKLSKNKIALVILNWDNLKIISRVNFTLLRSSPLDGFPIACLFHRTEMLMIVEMGQWHIRTHYILISWVRINYFCAQTWKNTCSCKERNMAQTEYYRGKRSCKTLCFKRVISISSVQFQELLLYFISKQQGS